MDLRFRDAEPTAEERAAVDALLGPPATAWDGGARTEDDLRFAARSEPARDLLLPALHAVNDRVGWISEGALDYICRRLTVPPAEAYGVASFYSLFAFEPRPARVLHVCTDLACQARGASEVRRGMEERLGPPGKDWKESPCLGLCERAPAALALEAGIAPSASTYGPITNLDAAPSVISPESVTPGSVVPESVTPSSPGPGSVNSESVTPGSVRPESVTPSSPGPGSVNPESVTPGPVRPESVVPESVRPESVRPESVNPQSVDLGSVRPGSVDFESVGSRAEPPVEAAVPQAGQSGLVLLRRVGVVDPASVDDYRAQGGYQALRRAFQLGPAGVIREVLDSGLVGRGGAAFPTGRKWDATARQPDHPHYLVCNADESEPGTFKDRVLMEADPYALIEAMTIAAYATGCAKGFLYLRGEYSRARQALENAMSTARARGLLGADILGQGFSFDIELRRGAGAYICGEETAIFNSIEGYRGEPRSKPPFPVEKGLFGKPTVVNNVETLVNVLPILERGPEAYKAAEPKLFCVSGNIVKPGVYELPFGATLRELLDLAQPTGNVRAVLLGGAAGAFVTDLDIPLTFEGTRQAGATLGSGVVLVLDDNVDLKHILLRIAEFFRDESCGQCVPCRVGTVRQEEALHRLSNRVDHNDLVLLRDVGQTMRDASICGLGQTAWNAVESAIDRLGVFR